MSDWNACASDPNPWIRWLECHPASAAWAQAGLTIAAIGVGVLVLSALWARDDKKKDIEGRKRAENLLVSVAGDIFTLSDSLHSAKKMVEGLSRKGLLPGPLPFRADTYAIAIPGGLNQAMMLAIALDAPAAESLFELMLSLIGYNARLKKIGATNLTLQEVSEVRAGLLLNLASIQSHMDAVMAYYGGDAFAP
jgi:hypothetical protein